MSAKPIPEGYHTVTAQLAVENASQAIEFYQKAFGAELLDQAHDPSGKKVMHAALRIGSSIVFVNDIFPEMGGSGTTSAMWLYVPDVDASYKRAVEAGAKAGMPPTDMFWGDRMGQVSDAFGQKWTIATHTQDLTPAEIKAAEEAFFKKQ